MKGENGQFQDIYFGSKITSQERLKLAKWILGIITLLFVFGAMVSLIWPDSAIFEACKVILTPIATLVIGFYFGEST